MSESEAKVVACIDGSGAAVAVCDYAAWASQRLQAPLELLHVVDPSQPPAPADLSGHLGPGSREHLPAALDEPVENRGRVLRAPGQTNPEAATPRVAPNELEAH